MDTGELIASFVSRTVVEVEREFPNGVQHTLAGPDDAAVRPRDLHPAFFGCLDWHSSVHSHWQLVRVLRCFPDADHAAAVEAVLDRSLTPEHLAVEVDYASRRPGWEMPYGMAWVLRLAAELRDWGGPRAARWHAAVEPLERLAVDRFHRLLDRYSHPVRSGVHSQTAFALGLALDWAAVAGDDALAAAIRRRSIGWFGDDRDAPLHWEPSGTDFLSPSLAEADLMRRVLDPAELAAWFARFVGGGVGRVAEHLRPVEVVDPSDGQLAHFAGLNISRAWMLLRLADALDEPALRDLAADHRTAGLDVALHDAYMVSHWVPTFVVYLLTAA